MSSVCAIDHVQIAMPAGGEAQARSFYSDLLGLEEVAKPPVLAARGGAWFERDSMRIHLGVDPSFKPASKAHVAFLVEDLNAFSETIRTAGLPVRNDDAIEGVSRFFTEDPFGNRIEIMQTPDMTR